MNDRAVVIPAQPGLWLVVLSRGPVAGEPWELAEQPLIAWDLSSVVYDIGAVPIGVLVKAWPDDQWAIRYSDGTYWVPHSDFGKTSSAEQVLAELIRQHDEQERKERRKA
jgi:hypothetical protein